MKQLRAKYAGLSREARRLVTRTRKGAGASVELVIHWVGILIGGAHQWEDDFGTKPLRCSPGLLRDRITGLLAECAVNPKTGGHLFTRERQPVLGFGRKDPRVMYYLGGAGLTYTTIDEWYAPRTWGMGLDEVNQPVLIPKTSIDELHMLLVLVSEANKLGLTEAGFEVREDGSFELGIRANGSYVNGREDDSMNLYQNRHTDDDTRQKVMAAIEKRRSVNPYGEDEEESYDGATPEDSDRREDYFVLHTGYDGVKPLGLAFGRYRIDDAIILANSKGFLKEPNEIRKLGKRQVRPKQVCGPNKGKRSKASIAYLVAGTGAVSIDEDNPVRPQHLRRLEQGKKRKFAVWNSKYFRRAYHVPTRKYIGWQARAIILPNMDVRVGQPDETTVDEIYGMLRGAIEGGHFIGKLIRRNDRHVRTRTHWCGRCKTSHKFRDLGHSHVCGKTDADYWMVKMRCWIPAELFPFLSLPDECTHLCVEVYGPLVGYYMRERKVGVGFNGDVTMASKVKQASPEEVKSWRAKEAAWNHEVADRMFGKDIPV